MAKDTVFNPLSGEGKDFGAPTLRSIMDQLSAEPGEVLGAMANSLSDVATTMELLMQSVSRQSHHISRTHADRVRKHMDELAEVATSWGGSQKEALPNYLQDAVRRFVFTLDVLRERGDIFLEHEAAGCPPVLIYDYEVIISGKTLPRPCNYDLLRIIPPADMSVIDVKRPYIIIDPRAGHGGGIGGFKSDSQVGVALLKGHPVYFVSFSHMPEPGQTLADVAAAEAEFVREVQRRHPKSHKPVVTGNCQGGWATLLLAATNPDLTGPIVLNGSPVQPWGGEIGKNPMRYNGGLIGGTYQPMLWSDLGGGVFDGAHLVMNFEQLNPSRNYFSKYYDVFENPEGIRQRFLGFERWWGGFFMLNEAEIRWIVEQLFVGNRLVKHQAQLEPGRTIDIKAVKAPVIVFTSDGDNITPPQQALNWIVDSYSDENEVKVRGQRIVYMIHEQVGHLGIFVSAKIAKKEHTEVASVMKTIEALAPGLYEMMIEEETGEGHEKSFVVSFAERSFEDLRQIDDGRVEEGGHAGVARLSELQAEMYDIALRPMVRAMVNPAFSEAMRSFHPLRVQRSAMSSHNPMTSVIQTWMHALPEMPAVSSDNPYKKAEKLWAGIIEQQLDLYRDVRDAMYEASFLALWTNPFAMAFGKPMAVGRTLMSDAELRTVPEVQSALANAETGGFVEAVIRMLVMIADSRGSVRRDRLERSATVLTQDKPFSDLDMDERSRIIHEQTLVVTFDPERAIESLPKLLRTKTDRRKALDVVQYIPGRIDEMAPNTLDLLQRFHAVLDLPPMTQDILDDPLSDQPAG
ncbi:MAG: DUF3141 domain-containing protein [Pseudomonadota bacterium]